MSDQSRRESTEGASSADWERRRRRAAIFGDALPETTRDEQTLEGEDRGSRDADQWLREQVPPHHGS